MRACLRVWVSECFIILACIQVCMQPSIFAIFNDRTCISFVNVYCEKMVLMFAATPHALTNTHTHYLTWMWAFWNEITATVAAGTAHLLMLLYLWHTFVDTFIHMNTKDTIIITIMEVGANFIISFACCNCFTLNNSFLHSSKASLMFIQNEAKRCDTFWMLNAMQKQIVSTPPRVYTQTHTHTHTILSILNYSHIWIL